MAINLQLKVKVNNSAFNSAVNSSVRNGIAVGDRVGTVSGATGVNSLEGDIADTPAIDAGPQLAMREQGNVPMGRDADSGVGGRGLGRRRPSSGEGAPGAGHHAAVGDVGDVPVSSSGNPFDRSRFADELQQKPWLRDKMAHISLGENQNPRANLSVIETMMNRAVVRGTSLEAQVRRHRSSGVDEGGYYAGYAPHYSGEQRAMFDRNLGAALGQGGRGQSNVSGYATDNSSGDLARRESATGAFVRHGDPVNGESFFSPGRAEPNFRDRWNALNRRAAEFERNRAQAAPVAARVPNTDENAP
jgi:hypothetical protein